MRAVKAPGQNGFEPDEVDLLYAANRAEARVCQLIQKRADTGLVVQRHKRLVPEGAPVPRVIREQPAARRADALYPAGGEHRLVRHGKQLKFQGGAARVAD